MRNNALGFSLKVWLTALFLGSLGSGIILTDGHTGFSGLISWLSLSIIFGGIFSLPSFAILFLSSWKLCNISLTNLNRKLILTGVGILSCLLAFYFAIDIFSTDFDLFLPYFVTIIASIWFYKLNPATQSSLIEEGN
jgi:hypothetical protein